MKPQQEQFTREVQKALENKIGRQLYALYHFDDTTAETHLLAVFDEETSIHHIRAALRPLYQSDTAVPLPLITTPATLARHLQLDPHFAGRLAETGRLLSGQAQAITSPPLSDAELISHTAAAALEASLALAPGLLPGDEAQTAAQKLFRLSRQLHLHQQASSPVETFAAVQAHLAQQIARQPQLQRQAPPPSDPPPLLVSLLAIYEVREQVIFLLPDWPPDRIKNYIVQVDWTAVAQSLKGQYKGLRISTPSLLRLVTRYQQPADYYFRSCTHAWGQDPLADLQIPHHQIIRELAHFPSQMEIEIFPQAYIATGNDRLDRLIHDFQNKLLNIQLREELLSRLNHRRRAAPPIPIPERAAPNTRRITTIFRHFNWWANHYTTLLNQEITS